MSPLQKESLEVKGGKRAEGRFSGEEALVFLSTVEGAGAVGEEGREVVGLVEAEEMGVLPLRGGQDSWAPEDVMAGPVAARWLGRLLNCPCTGRERHDKNI